MVNMQMENEYSTLDLSLAAYLYACGFKVTIIKNGFPYSFVVSTTSNLTAEHLQDKLREWQIGSATGNIPNYYNAYKFLQRQVVAKNGD